MPAPKGTPHLPRLLRFSALLLALRVGEKAASAYIYNEAEQRHLSAAGPGRVAVQWVTPLAGPAVVSYGLAPDDLASEAWGSTESYGCDEDAYFSGKLHRAVLGSYPPLVAGVTYYYRCGEDGNAVLSFVAPSVDLVEDERPPSVIAVLGGLGQSDRANATLQRILAAGPGIVLDAGDSADANCSQQRWDIYGRLVEQVAGGALWMPTQGDEEQEDPAICGESLGEDFLAYRLRYEPPLEECNSTSSLFYSFEALGAHFLMLSSEAGCADGSEQMRWLKADLATVNRTVTPWLIGVIHMPLYSSRLGEYYLGGFLAMETVLRGAGLDAMFSGHVRAYERTDRVYNSVLDTCAPAYFNVGGSARRAAAGFSQDPPEWSASRESGDGFALLTLHNATHASVAWQADGAESTSDETWLVRPLHCEAPPVPDDPGGSSFWTTRRILAVFIIIGALIATACYMHSRHRWAKHALLTSQGGTEMGIEYMHQS